MTRIVIRRNKTTKLVIKPREPRYWSVHTHSKYSFNDALPSVKEIVAEAQRLRYKGLALTDHGNMAGSVELYKACVKAGIKPFPGSEIYLVLDREDKKAKRYHLGLVAYTTQGYRNLIHISTRSHLQFHYKPLLDLADLAELHEQGRTEGIALTTGCYFGLVIQTLIKDGYEAAKHVVAMYSKWFDTYIEVQGHSIDHGDDVLSEDAIATALASMASELGLPLVAAQDSHYVHQKDREIHDSFKRVVAFGPEADDAVFPGDGFHLATQGWVERHLPREVFERCLDGLDLLLSKWDLHIDEIDHYDYRIPDVGNTDFVKRRVLRRASELNLTQRYIDQIYYEFEIIDTARMWGYLGLVAKVCDHMREVAMFYQVRGSAGGSLVCWLLEITNVDPIKWKLRMDRFLSKDRTKPPDIDLDIEHDRRQELIEWLRNEYAVRQIGTWRTYSIAGDGNKGSLRVRWISRQKAMGNEGDWLKIAPEDKGLLQELSARELYAGVGTHPAGLIVTNTRAELDQQVPLMWIVGDQKGGAKGHLVSQYDGPTVESIGLVKLDVLGLKTLSVISRCLVNMGMDPGEGLEFIPLGDSTVYTMISKGMTDGVFQLEGKASKRGVKDLRPTKISDVIAAMALFRPAAMASGATNSFIARKFKEEAVPERHQIIAAATKDTHGVIVYQDQVIEILRALGMGPDDLTAFLKVVKASNGNVGAAAEVMSHYGPMVHTLAAQAGMTTEDVDWLWEALSAFAEYSFNRAHATIYGITAYRCAWLSKHHHLEFFAALLDVAAGSDKERPYQIAARSRNIRLLKPDVNYSRASYAVDPNRRGIRRGLSSIKGIGVSAAQAIESQQPFESLDDFAARVNGRSVSGIKDYLNSKTTETGKVNMLRKAGAFESIGVKHE